jgi:hypothetical protein
MGHIGDGDPDHVPARVLRVVVGMGQTASSRSRASAGSMVTSGRSRRSAALKLAGFAASASAITASGKGVGDAVLVDGDQATAFGAPGSPSRSTMRARGRPIRPLGPACSASTNSPSARAMSVSGAHLPFLVGSLVDRHDAPALGALAEDAQDSRGFVPIRRISRATY